MKNRLYSCVILFTFCLCLLTIPASATPPPGGAGYVTINCNVDGASVYLDGILKGIISGGSLDIPDGIQYNSYTVQKTGYSDVSGDINYVPGGETNIEIAVILDPKPAGSSKGWFVVHCNIDGASVAFNGATKGSITDGTYQFEVITTGTPYTSYSVSRSGYVTAYESISRMPADGETLDLYATLNPVPTTTVPTTVATPIGGDAGWIAVHSNVNGASVYFDNTFEGTIANGVLSVAVYTTGTPYTTYRLEKSGYVTATGSLPTAPAKGVTKDVYVTMTLTQTQAPIGSGSGQYAVHCSEDGAEVYFDGVFMGMVNNGVATITVTTTGTPAKTYEVRKVGFYTATDSITRYPENGQTIDLYVTLHPRMVTAPTTKSTTLPATTVPEPTQSPVPLPLTIGALLMITLIAGAARQRRQ